MGNWWDGAGGDLLGMVENAAREFMRIKEESAAAEPINPDDVPPPMEVPIPEISTAPTQLLPPRRRRAKLYDPRRAGWRRATRECGIGDELRAIHDEVTASPFATAAAEVRRVQEPIDVGALRRQLAALSAVKKGKK